MTDAADAFARSLAAQGAALDFQHDGLIFLGVPAEAVASYAATRLAHQPADAVLRAIMEGFAGETVYAQFSPHADWILWRIARGWAVRLSDLERRLRGLTPSRMGIAA